MNSYTAEQKSEALAAVEEHGLAEASRRCDIPKQTLGGWAKAAGIKTYDTSKTRAANEARKLAWEQRKQDLTDRMGAAAEKALERVEANLYEVEHKKIGYGDDAEWEANYTANSAKGYATTLAILIDKAQLLSGGATGRTETTSMSREEIERKLKELRNDELAQRRERKSA